MMRDEGWLIASLNPSSLTSLTKNSLFPVTPEAKLFS
jgi:hypothetical protein